MKSTGFGYPGGPDRAANLELPVTSYSGGWKMKMQLCAAKLMNCDVLMLDEPTGHLDVDNIKWLEEWLESFTGSIICTSHFTPFLDKMCTHIIDFQDRKLKTFKGVKGNTLTMFVEKYPDGGEVPPVTSSTDDRELLPIHTKRAVCGWPGGRLQMARGCLRMAGEVVCGWPGVVRGWPENLFADGPVVVCRWPEVKSRLLADGRWSSACGWPVVVVCLRMAQGFAVPFGRRRKMGVIRVDRGWPGVNRLVGHFSPSRAVEL